MKLIIPIIILIAFLAILGGANIYLARRFNYYFSIESSWILYFVFAFITVFMLFGSMAFTNGTSIFSTIIYAAGTILLGFMIYLLLSTLVLHLTEVFTAWSPRTYGVLALIFAAAISAFGIWNSYNIRTTNYDITLNGLEKDIKAVHLTDIHIGHFRGEHFLKKVISKTNDQSPDVVFLTGDLFDGKIRLGEENFLPFKQLKAPVYFVEGNHDNYTGVKEIKEKLRAIGVHVLENEMIEAHGMNIIGLNHMLADSTSFDMHAAPGSATVQSILEELNIDKSAVNVVLHHSPDGIKYASENGVDLYLAGHTHAGQMFPINLISNLIFEYNRGMHDYKGTTVFVSEGLGTFGPPMRIATKSELAVLNLNK